MSLDSPTCAASEPATWRARLRRDPGGPRRARSHRRRASLGRTRPRQHAPADRWTPPLRRFIRTGLAQCQRRCTLGILLQRRASAPGARQRQSYSARVCRSEPASTVRGRRLRRLCRPLAADPRHSIRRGRLARCRLRPGTLARSRKQRRRGARETAFATASKPRCLRSATASLPTRTMPHCASALSTVNCRCQTFLASFCVWSTASYSCWLPKTADCFILRAFLLPCASSMPMAIPLALCAIPPCAARRGTAITIVGRDCSSPLQRLHRENLNSDCRRSAESSIPALFLIWKAFAFRIAL